MTNSDLIEIVRSIYSIDVPDVYKDKIQVLVRNGDEFEGAEKYAYRFEKPVECPFYPGYFYIPGFSRYVISVEGIVKNVLVGRNLKWSLASKAKECIRGGYRTMLITSDQGFRKGLTRHRALVLTFKQYHQHPNEFLVNHKNGVGGDDWLDNLEICTSSQNVQHAYDIGLYPNRVRPIDAHNWITNLYYSFDRIQTCVDTLVKIDHSITYQLVSGRLRTGSSKRHSDGWRFKNKEQQWSDLDKNVNHLDSEKEVICRNVLDSVVHVFRSISEASRELKMSNGTIRDQCVNKVRVPVNGFQFRFLSEFGGWPNYSEQQIEIFRDCPMRPSDGIEVYDLNTNETRFFTTCIAAAEYYNLSPITVSKLARYEGVRANRYKFKLVRVRENY